MGKQEEKPESARAVQKYVNKIIYMIVMSAYVKE